MRIYLVLDFEVQNRAASLPVGSVNLQTALFQFSEKETDTKADN